MGRFAITLKMTSIPLTRKSLCPVLENTWLSNHHSARNKDLSVCNSLAQMFKDSILRPKVLIWAQVNIIITQEIDHLLEQVNLRHPKEQNLTILLIWRKFQVQESIWMKNSRTLVPKLPETPRLKLSNQNSLDLALTLPRCPDLGNMSHLTP